MASRGEVFSHKEEQVLHAILDALFADLGDEGAQALLAAQTAHDPRSDEELVAFARRPASAFTDSMDIVRARLATFDGPDQDTFHALLKTLATRVGCLALTGKRGPLYRHEAVVVQGILKSWFTSPLQQIRELGKVFKLLASVFFLQGDGAKNPNFKAMGYEPPDMAVLREVVNKATAVDFNKCRIQQMEFLQQPSGGIAGPQPIEVLCDCVVVGSGPGGAVVAAELTEAGFRVALLERGRWRAPGEQSCSEAGATRELYQEAGNFFTSDHSISILAGSCFGGGASLNWSCCLPPPEQVREEWARDFGLDWAAGPAMAEAVERVRHRLSIHSEGVELNAANQVLMRGCERLGYASEIAAQQGWQPQSPDDGGWCSLGWKQGRRQGMHGSALADAAQTGRLLLLDGCSADEILRDRTGSACGVRATMRDGTDSRTVIVRGRGVVVAGGALLTPLLLRRSGLKNPHIGRHLRLHPAMTIWGRFDEPIRFFEGAPMTTVSRVVEDQDGKGYGAKIWVPNLHPATFATLSPWHGPQEFKQALASYAHAAPLISLVRDQGEGKVWENSNQRVKVSYSMPQIDKLHLQRALDHAARILVAAGAREVHSAHSRVEPLRLSGSDAGTQAQLELWLAQLRAEGMPTLGVMLGSAHQMGTCRMAASPKLGAAKPTGETWEVPGLFVADTSTFPTASGVNPMWTCAAIAQHTAQNVKQHLETSAELREPVPSRRQRVARRCMSSACAGSPDPAGKPSPRGEAHAAADASTSISECSSPPSSVSPSRSH